MVQYECMDGMKFSTREEAEQHEEKLKQIHIYKVYAGPDLTEGRYGPKYKGVILINSPYYEELARYWAYNSYGNEYGLIQGVVTKPQKMWFLETIDKVYSVDDILAKIEDRNPVELIWGEHSMEKIG